MLNGVTFFQKVPWLVGVALLLVSCKEEVPNGAPDSMGDVKGGFLFERIAATDSGLDFVNPLEETLESNYYKYLYTYIGGGVAAGDINNDGLIDLYFTANTGQDKLYLNQGDFKFEDITEKTGINQNEGFNTGVTMVDINGDGYLDIYVSRGGWKDEDGKFNNLLYINNHDLSFTERAVEFGLADPNRTIQTLFFDFDKDNDLDAYVCNTPDITGKARILDLDQVHKDPKTLMLKGSDRLYENNGQGYFTDISEKAGLQFDLGFGLNPIVGDLNNDSWLDIYVCNDFNYPDLAYINNGNGTFTESRDDLFKHMSFNSMGSDMADIDNDGHIDLLTLDMNPEDYVRSKTTMGMTSISTFEEMVAKGYHHQYMHNMLQINNGNGTFSEIGQMAGIAKTDWSWAILAADFNLDGHKDLFVTNGVFRDVIDRDKNNEILQLLQSNGRKPTDEDFLQFAKMLPQQKLNNYFFKNNGDRTFVDATDQWIDAEPSFSNGAIYADLDNDGDLDVVVNNINDRASLLKNNTRERASQNYLQLQLVGSDANSFGLGAKVHLHFEDGVEQIQQMINTRGFLSSVPNRLHFGLGDKTTVKKLEVVWPDGRVQQIDGVKANQTLLVSYENASTPVEDGLEPVEAIVTEVAFDHKHEDRYFNDYGLQLLLPHKLSQTGPALASADVNRDGLDDIFIGGGAKQPAQLFMGTKSNGYTAVTVPDFEKDKLFEDQAACFFDADGDGNLDLYVVSGSYEFYRNPLLLQDRLYMGDGSGNFVKGESKIPDLRFSGSVVRPMDYDGDGDMDLFVGGRLVPGKYPYPADSYLLVNEGGVFRDATPRFATAFQQLGMVTDAVWEDVNDDGKMDLLVTGEWMGIEVFINQNNLLIKSERHQTLSDTVGWWNRILVADVDGDGDKDIIAGNLGLNYKFRASIEKPFHVYTSDFDFNGIEDVVLAKEYQGRQVPIRGKTCMTQQLPHLANKIPTFREFANSDVQAIMGQRVTRALHYEATEFRSGIFLNENDENYVFQPFENTVQQSPINSIIYEDIDRDGIADLVMAGNNFQSEVETTRADAGVGVFLKGLGNGNFKSLRASFSGFFADGDVRQLVLVNQHNRQALIVANNNAAFDMFKVN